MTIAQAERFYKQDTKKYDISKNKELLTWLKKAIKKGYHSFIDVEYIQELIDNIVYWYEMKYPERELEFSEGTIYRNFEDIENLSKVMDLKQLMYRLPHKQLCLMECNYRSKGGSIRYVYNDKGEKVGQKKILFIRIDRKGIEYNPFSCSKLPDFLLHADPDSGKVDVDYNLKMLSFDPQTAGGLFICADKDNAENILADLWREGIDCASIIGKVHKKEKEYIHLVK